MIEFVGLAFVIGITCLAAGFYIGENVGRGNAYRDELSRKIAAEENNKMAAFIEKMRGSS